MLEYKMKDLTLCIACVILGILLAMMFKQACGCKQVVEGLGEDCTTLLDGIPFPNNTCVNGEECHCHNLACSCQIATN